MKKTKNTISIPIRAIMYFGLCMSVVSMYAQAGITFGPLVGSSVQDTPTCFDQSTGELGTCSTASSTSYARSVLVSQSGTGDYSSPIDALAEIGVWCTNSGALTNLNRCEIRIGPGTYDLGTASLDMVDYVDIRGAGRSTTNILSDVEFDTTGDPTGVINSARASLQNLSVYNFSDNANPDFAAIVVLVSTLGFRMENVNAIKSAGATAGGSVAVVVLGGGNVSIMDSFLYGQGGDDSFGLLVEESTASVRGSLIWARNGSNNNSVEVFSDTGSSKATILHSTTEEIAVKGAGSELFFHWSGAKTAITVSNGASAACLYSFEVDSLMPLDTDCSL